MGLLSRLQLPGVMGLLGGGLVGQMFGGGGGGGDPSAGAYGQQPIMGLPPTQPGGAGDPAAAAYGGAGGDFGGGAAGMMGMGKQLMGMSQQQQMPTPPPPQPMMQQGRGMRPNNFDTQKMIELMRMRGGR